MDAKAHCLEMSDPSRKSRALVVWCPIIFAKNSSSGIGQKKPNDLGLPNICCTKIICLEKRWARVAKCLTYNSVTMQAMHLDSLSLSNWRCDTIIPVMSLILWNMLKNASSFHYLVSTFYSHTVRQEMQVTWRSESPQHAWQHSPQSPRLSTGDPYLVTVILWHP